MRYAMCASAQLHELLQQKLSGKNTLSAVGKRVENGYTVNGYALDAYEPPHL